MPRIACTVCVLQARLHGRTSASFVDVFDVSTPHRLVRLAQLSTAPGARTGLWSPELKQLFVAAPHRDGHEAAIHVYEVGGPSTK
jgi:hypothetical protein